jgi:hypothetical protein
MTGNLPANIIPAAVAPPRISQATEVERSRAVAEVQAAVMVAQANRRDVLGAYAAMRSACRRLALAQQAFYRVVNRGEGPSIHLARELARIWGNLDNGVRELRRGDEESEVLAYAWDQEQNVRTSRSFIVPHQRMVNVNGTPTRRDLVDLQDVYLNNQNVGARALRECIFAMLPSEFVNEAIDTCRATIRHGDGVPLEERIRKAIAMYAAMGVRAVRIERRLGRHQGQWTAADVAELAIIHSSINRGDTTADDEFPAETITVAELHTQATPQTPPAPAPASPPTPGPAVHPDDTGLTPDEHRRRMMPDQPEEKPWQPSPTQPAPTPTPPSPDALTTTTSTPTRADAAKTPRNRRPPPDPVVEDPPDVGWPDVPTIPGTETPS